MAKSPLTCPPTPTCPSRGDLGDFHPSSYLGQNDILQLRLVSRAINTVANRLAFETIVTCMEELNDDDGDELLQTIVKNMAAM